MTAIDDPPDAQRERDEALLADAARIAARQLTPEARFRVGYARKYDDVPPIPREVVDEIQTPDVLSPMNWIRAVASKAEELHWEGSLFGNGPVYMMGWVREQFEESYGVDLVVGRPYVITDSFDAGRGYRAVFLGYVFLAERCQGAGWESAWRFEEGPTDSIVHFSAKSWIEVEPIQWVSLDHP